MTDKKIALFYSCPLGHGKYKNRKCGRCGAICTPIFELPTERNPNTDSSYFDYLRKHRDKES